MSHPKSIAHRTSMNVNGAARWPDGLVDWDENRPADLTDYTHCTHRLGGCAYCGSMHPADLVAALKAGAKLDPADWKYGWPHKYYVNGIPNPFQGMAESIMSASHAVPICPNTGVACAQHSGPQSFSTPVCACMAAGTPTKATTPSGNMVRIRRGYSSQTGAPEYTWMHEGEPAGPTTHGKFYTEHLQDATPEDKLFIEQAIGLHIDFVEGGKRVTWRPYGQAPKE